MTDATEADAIEQDDAPVHIAYSGFLFCRLSKETIGKYEGETYCAHCDETIDEPIPRDPDGTLRLTDWLENQKERAEERMNDESLPVRMRAKWRGEYRLASAIQCYVRDGVLELE